MDEERFAQLYNRILDGDNWDYSTLDELICLSESGAREENRKDMKKQYVIARYWRGSYVETMCEPTTKKDADKRCAKLQEKEDPLNEYKVLKIPTTNKKVTYV